MRRLALIALACAALAGCGASPRIEPPRVAAGEPLGSVPEPIADRVGFAVRDDGSWRRGDTVLYEIVIDADDRRRRSFMLIEVLGDMTFENGAGVRFSSPVSFTLRVDDTELRSDALETTPAHFRSLDEQGEPAFSNTIGVYNACLEQGYHATIELARSVEADAGTPHDPEAFAGVVWIFLLGAGMQHESVMSTYLKGLANMPPLHSYLLNMGLKAEIDTTARPIDGVWRSHDGALALPCIHQPVSLRLNGTDALTGRFTGVPDTPPLTTGGGIVEAHVWNPMDPEREARIRVIGAWNDDGQER